MKLKVIDMIINKYKPIVISLLIVLKEEWLLLVLVTLFTISIAIHIFKWYHFLLFVPILLIGRTRKYNMSIATYLVVFTVALTALGLQQQNLLSKEQLKKFEREEKYAKNDRIIKLEELRSSLRDLMDIYSYMVWQNRIVNLPRERQLAIYNKISEILNSQISNPVLIENKECFDYWRNAIEGTRTMLSILLQINTDTNDKETIGVIMAMNETISHNFIQVWVKLIPVT